MEQRDRASGPDLAARTKRFAIEIIRLYSALPRCEEARVWGRQLLRSGTSIGAQYREGLSARSQAEFVSKLGGALQEAEETSYWLELLDEVQLAPADRLSQLTDEAGQLTAILAASVKTAQAKLKVPRER